MFCIVVICSKSLSKLTTDCSMGSSKKSMELFLLLSKWWGDPQSMLSWEVLWLANVKGVEREEEKDKQEPIAAHFGGP